jgi:hypothetical protein
MYVGARRRVVIAMVRRHLVVLIVAIIGPVLRADGGRGCRCECQREQTRNERL